MCLKNQGPNYPFLVGFATSLVSYFLIVVVTNDSQTRASNTTNLLSYSLFVRSIKWISETTFLLEVLRENSFLCQCSFYKKLLFLSSWPYSAVRLLPWWYLVWLLPSMRLSHKDPCDCAVPTWVFRRIFPFQGSTFNHICRIPLAT